MLHLFFYLNRSIEFNKILSCCRLQALCDMDTEDEDDKAISNKPKNLHRRQLSFSDDESSSTSEFDPGDYVPPKYVHTKGKKCMMHNFFKLEMKINLKIKIP